MSAGNRDGVWRDRDTADAPGHAFDPLEEPDLFRGVLTRRAFAFLIDLIVMSIPVILAVIFIAVFGVLTLGLGWALFWLVSPATVVWALIYYGSTLGGPHSATIGMRIIISNSAPGMAPLAILCWAPPTRCCSGSQSR